mmetsp:Transcript_82484/g.229976  ORF Transcript_82484/g.229976 Transcript_82484/m.229976 type:complete len:293 (-) Transcript_82484:82-960(-)|eukprot:CAMPEP_0117527392 /NCGR_PEP_ID=MMETSP0784-20121206/36773_1 /TAXON_ID=39447 /ORGANISM="" /LENGTH=292 /DNA_ID=CAMNT_0005323641 /DNA_START=100 /DNA_END=978 /DNA_ORIENTATION=-
MKEGVLRQRSIRYGRVAILVAGALEQRRIWAGTLAGSARSMATLPVSFSRQGVTATTAFGVAEPNAPSRATWEAAVASAAKMPAHAPRFILGSASASRRALLAATGAEFDVVVPDIDEKAIGDRAGGDARSLVQLVAEAKADALLAQLGVPGSGMESSVLLTGDQVVTYCGSIREKPANVEEARAFMESYKMAPCTTVGAACLHDLRSGRRVVGVHQAEVHFSSEIPDAVVDVLVADDEILRCAGGLMVEHPALAPYILRIDGGTDAIMGLSISLVVKLLTQLRRLGTEGSE